MSEHEEGVAASPAEGIAETEETKDTKDTVETVKPNEPANSAEPEKKAPTEAVSTTEVPAEVTDKKPKKKRRLLWWILGGVLVLLAALATLTWQMKWYQPVYDLYNVGSITLKVKEGDKFPIEGAKLVLKNNTYTTDATGKVSVAKIVAGTYSIQVSADGYNALSQNLVIKRGDNDIAYLALTKSTAKLYTISGFVTDYVSGTGLSDVQVSVSGTTVKTDPSGSYSFSKLPPADYKLVFSKTGFTAKEVPAALTDADITGTKVPIVPAGSVIFVSNRDGKRSLYITDYDGNNVRQFVAPAGGGEDYSPSISANGKWVAYLSTRDQIKDGYGNIMSRLYLVNIDTPKSVIKVSDDIVSDYFVWSPNSHYLYFSGRAGSNQETATYRFYDTAKNSTFDLGEPTSNVSFSADGEQAVYSLSSKITSGTPPVQSTVYSIISLTIASGARKTLASNLTIYPDSVAFLNSNATVVYEQYVGNAKKRYEITASDLSVKEVALNAEQTRYYSLSPKSDLKAFMENRDGKSDLYTVDAANKNEKKLTISGVVSGGYPLTWDNSGRYITYAIRREAETAIYIVATSGGESKKVTDYAAQSAYAGY